MIDALCWPTLADPYLTALREAVAFILERFDPLGIIAAGSILRGQPGPSSDLDLYVIHGADQRQRLQQWFNGVPAEIFVNPPAMMERYFEDERKAGRPLTAHMLATGFVVLDRDPVIARLRQRAQDLIDLPPDPSPERLSFMRYMLACQFEDALDIADTAPVGASMILGLAAHGMLQYRFWQANRYLPRDKDLLDALSDLDPHLAQLALDFFAAPDLERRLPLAERIADRTIQTRGFFVWESAAEAV